MSHFSELAIPAGSLQCALYSFKGGADAVYFGAKLFSARNAAVNFSFEDMRKLKTFCIENNKRFYVTVNTLVNDPDFKELDTLLRELDFIEPDGIIVQDLGVASYISRFYPKLVLNASTQLAVHTTDGVKVLASLGFKRVVLSRELSFEEIKEIREKCPDTELKVFIHGALCYGFSGQCLASQIITGRSANCGKCAQICRSWFHCTETDEDGCFFSMKDYDLGQKVRLLQNIGIDSLKVEGRMKGPEYCYWTAKYYSLVLEGHSENEQEVIWAREAMKTAFSREGTENFFNIHNHKTSQAQNLVSCSYPGHRGIKTGSIIRTMKGRAIVKFDKSASLRDGLLVVNGLEGVGFALSGIEGKSFVSAGETAQINFPSAQFRKPVPQGTPVYCISRHNMTFPVIAENMALVKKTVDIDIVIDDTGITVNNKHYNAGVQEATGCGNIERTLKQVFEASDKSLYRSGAVNIKNESRYGSVFIPLSQLKSIRRQFYSEEDNRFYHKCNSIVQMPDIKCCLPERSKIALWDTISEIDGKKYMSLAPVMFNEDEYKKKLECIIEENPGITVGLNNIAQVLWAKSHPDVPVYADFFLYTANSLSWKMLKEILPNLIGSYEFSSDTRFCFTGQSFKAPLFVSRVCFRHNALGLSCASCSRYNVFNIDQNGNRYIVYCKDCITVVRQN